MQINDAGLALIKRFEGCRLTAYKPVAAEKYYTIGYGHYGADVTKGMVITQAQADAYLRADLNKFENAVNALGREWTANQFSSLVSFAFNCGAGNLQTLCKNRTAAQIAEKMLLYNKGASGVLQGLVTRRNAERALFLSDSASTISTSTITGSSKPVYEVGKTYTTQVRLLVRKGAGTNYKAKAQNELTASAQAHAQGGVLNKGTKVTCQDSKTVGTNIWVKIPSGWIAAYYMGQTYLA